MRTKVWWPNTNNDITRYVKSCISCTATSQTEKPMQIHTTLTSNKPWETTHMESCGFFPNGNVTLALIDEYSQ